MIVNKNKFLEMGYEVLETVGEEMDTLYKKFDNGNMWIVQFNEAVQEDAVGMIYLTDRQVEEIFSK